MIAPLLEARVEAEEVEAHPVAPPVAALAVPLAVPQVAAQEAHRAVAQEAHRAAPQASQTRAAEVVERPMACTCPWHSHQAAVGGALVPLP